VKFGLKSSQRFGKKSKKTSGGIFWLTLYYSSPLPPPPPPRGFLTFSPKGWDFLVQILHAYCTFLSTLDYKFLCNYLQLWRSYPMCDHPACVSADGGHFEHDVTGWSCLIWHNFVTDLHIFAGNGHFFSPPPEYFPCHIVKHSGVYQAGKQPINIMACIGVLHLPHASQRISKQRDRQ